MPHPQSPFIQLSNSPVDEPSSRFLTWSPYEKRCPSPEPFRNILQGPREGSPPSRFPSQSSHRERDNPPPEHLLTAWESLNWICSSAAVINLNVHFFYRMMMMMMTTMTMMIKVQEQIRTQFFWDMWRCANGWSNPDVAGQGRNYSARTHRRLKMRTLHCFETSVSDHPLSQCRIPEERSPQLHTQRIDQF